MNRICLADSIGLKLTYSRTKGKLKRAMKRKKLICIYIKDLYKESGKNIAYKLITLNCPCNYGFPSEV